jgi:hypothetical protein
MGRIGREDTECEGGEGEENECPLTKDGKFCLTWKSNNQCMLSDLETWKTYVTLADHQDHCQWQWKKRCTWFVELMQYCWNGAHVDETRLAMKEGDHFFLLAETAKELLFGKNGNPRQLCVRRKAQVLTHWLYL